MAKPAIQQKLETFCYGIGRGNRNRDKSGLVWHHINEWWTSPKSLEKMRRMLKAMEGKVKTLVKVCGRNQGKFRTEKGNWKFYKWKSAFEKDDIFPSYDEFYEDSFPLAGPSEAPQSKSHTE